MNKIICLIIICISLSSCGHLAYKDIVGNSDFVFNSKLSDLGEFLIYFDSYEQTETKFIFFDKQGKLMGEAPLTKDYVIRRNLNKRITK